MDEKRKSKRKSMDEGYWDCSVCTYKNTPEAFKCEMCDVRKGTSTRKPRLNPQLVAQQAAQQFPVAPKRERTSRGELRDRCDAESDYRDSSSYMETSSTDVSPSSTRDRLDLNDVDSPPKETIKLEPVPSKEHVKEPKVKSEKTSASTSSTPRTCRRPHKLTQFKNIDRSTARSMEVTVGDVTVVITDYKPKKDKQLDKNNSSLGGDQGTPVPASLPVSQSASPTNNHVSPKIVTNSTNI